LDTTFEVGKSILLESALAEERRKNCILEALCNELKMRLKQEEESRKEKDSLAIAFMESIAHDIRSNVVSVHQFGNIIKETFQDGANEERELVQNCAVRITDITSDVLKTIYKYLELWQVPRILDI